MSLYLLLAFELRYFQCNAVHKVVHMYFIWNSGGIKAILGKPILKVHALPRPPTPFHSKIFISIWEHFGNSSIYLWQNSAKTILAQENLFFKPNAQEKLPILISGWDLWWFNDHCPITDEIKMYRKKIDENKNESFEMPSSSFHMKSLIYSV